MRNWPTISNVLTLLLLLASPVVATFEPLALLERPEPPPPAQFGRAVAVDGNTVVVGSLGGVYVFERRGPREFVPVARLRPSLDLAPGLFFGTTVAVSGETIAVGTTQFNFDSTEREHVFVYERPGSGWRDMTETTRITSPVGHAIFFGDALALEGDTLAIGARFGGVDADGEVYVYERSPQGWGSPVNRFSAPHPKPLGPVGFGTDIALSGSTLVVGSVEEDVEGLSSHGAAYAFSRSGASWASVEDPPAQLLPSDGLERLFFGISVDVERNAILVGSVGATGAAYLFERPPGGWVSGTETAKLLDPLQAEGFGVDVALEGGWAFVSSPQPIPSGAMTVSPWRNAAPSTLMGSLLELGTVGDPVHGVVFGYVRPNTGWADVQPSLELQLDDPGSGSNVFGFSLATDGVLVAGAPLWDLDGGASNGLVAVFAEPLVTEVPVGGVALGVLALSLAVIGIGVLRFFACPLEDLIDHLFSVEP